MAITWVNLSSWEEREGGDKRRVRWAVGVFVDGCLVGIAKSSERSMARAGGILFECLDAMDIAVETVLSRN